MNFLRIVLFLTASLIGNSESAKILGLFTRFSRSHVIVHLSVVKALTDQGHNVTIVTTMPLKDSNPKYKHILLTPDEEDSKTLERIISQVSNTKSLLTSIQYHTRNLAHMTNMQYNAMRRSELQELLNTNMFDLLILGSSVNDFQLAIAAQLRVPVVLSWLITPVGVINSYTGNPSEVSYVPNVLVSDEQPMTFRHRLENFYVNLVFYGMEKFGSYKHRQYYE